MNISSEGRLAGLFESSRHLSECGSLDGFLNGMLDQLSTTLACDAGIFFLHGGDPGGCDWIAWAGKGVGEDFRLRYPRYFGHDPFARWLAAHHNAIPQVTTGDRLIRYDRFVRSQIYEEFFRPNNVHHILNINLVGRQEVFGHLCLYRPEGRARFRQREFRLACLLAPMLVVATRKVLAEGRLDQYERGLEALGRRPAQGATLLLHSDGRPLYADAPARNLLARFSPAGNWREALTGDLGAALLRHCREQGQAVMRARCELPVPRSRQRIVCHIERIDRTTGEPSFLVELQSELAAAPRVGRMLAGGLSRRERDVASAVALGRTNEEVAAALCISVNTVQTHLKSVYRKLEVRNRAELVRVLAAQTDVFAAGSAV